MSKWDFIRKIITKNMQNADDVVAEPVNKAALYREYLQNKKAYADEINGLKQYADETGSVDSYYQALNDAEVEKHLLNELIESMSNENYPPINDIINARDPNYSYRHYRR